MEKCKGKLKGAIVLLKDPRPVHPNFNPPASRLDDKGLREIEDMPIPVKPAKPDGPGGASGLKWEELEEFFKAEEAGCLVRSGRSSRNG
jgi:hypothetical protein